MSLCDEHARRLQSIEEFLRVMHRSAKRSSTATLLTVVGMFVTVLVTVVAGFFQLAAARAELRKDLSQPEACGEFRAAR